MKGQTTTIHAARWFMILTAIALSPVYVAWVFGGWLLDKRDRRRATRLTHCFP